MNLLLQFILLFIAIKCENQSRQYNEDDLLRYSQSIIVSIRYFNSHYCSGAILTESYILTAANCVDTLPNNITIVVKTLDRSIEVDQIIIHPNWTHNKKKNKKFEDNIALLHLSDPLDFIIDKETYSFALSKTTKLRTIEWNTLTNYFDAKTSIDLQNHEVFLVDKNGPVCNAFVDTDEQLICVRFNPEMKEKTEELLLQWTNNRWMPIGLLSSVLNQTNDSYSGIYTRLEFYRKWMESIISSKYSVGNATTYACDRSKVSCGCSRENVVLSSTRIIGGEESVPHSWGMTVSIRFNDSEIHSCTGSILTHTYVLTSASCVHGVSSEGLHVAAGMHDPSKDFVIIRYVHEIHIHPNWNESDDNYENDIAILYVFPPLPVDSNDLLARTCVPYTNSLNETINYPSSDNHLVTVSWGSTQYGSKNMSNTLQQISAYVIDNDDPICSQSIDNVETQFCGKLQGATDEDLNYGDLGSPVFQWKGNYWEQVGIVNFHGEYGYGNSSNIFTRLAYYIAWMESIIGHSFTTTTTTPRPTPPPTFYSCNNSLSCGCGTADVALVSSRIVGGTDAVEHSWPMMVSIRLHGSNSHMCGGTIVSSSYILTAAHCFGRGSTENIKGITIAAGMTNRSDPLQIIRYVDRVYIHPNFSDIPGEFEHDIALLHINQSFFFESNSLVTKTCIHRIDPPLLINQYPSNGTRLAVIGWGALHSNSLYLPELLQQVQVFTIDNEEQICLNSLQNRELQFCAGLYEGGKDSCQGDSGGPIFQWAGQYWEQVGIVSYGVGCAEVGYPGIYTRLSYYYQWIENILKLDGEYLEPTDNRSTTATTTTTMTTTTTTTMTTTTTTTMKTTTTTTMTSTTLTTNNLYKYKLNIFVFGFSFLLLFV